MDVEIRVRSNTAFQLLRNMICEHYWPAGWCFDIQFTSAGPMRHSDARLTPHRRQASTNYSTENGSGFNRSAYRRRAFVAAVLEECTRQNIAVGGMKLEYIEAGAFRFDRRHCGSLDQHCRFRQCRAHFPSGDGVDPTAGVWNRPSASI